MYPNSYHRSIFLVIILLSLWGSRANTDIRSGHEQKFGTGKLHELDEFAGFPSAMQFFEHYVNESKPLKMTSAYSQSAAVTNWSDQYLLELDVPSDFLVTVETVKKERRDQVVREIPFKEFLSVYDAMDIYMVDTVPVFLRYTVCCVVKGIFTNLLRFLMLLCHTDFYTKPVIGSNIDV